MMNNYGTPPLALASGDGAVVTDENGKSYLDLLGGIAVNILGHRHPADHRGRHHPAEHAGPHLEPVRHRTGYRAGRGARRPARRRRAGAGVLLQLRHRGQRGRLQNHPAHRAHQTRCRPGRFPRPDDGFAGADRPARQTGAVRAAARLRHARALRRRRRARSRRRRRHRRGVPRADHGRGRRRRTAGRLPGRRPRDHQPATVRCWYSTRCRPASGAPAPSSPTSTTASPPTSSRWQRVSAADCRSGRAWPSARPPT